MSEPIVKIAQRYLKAAALFAAEGDVRHYMNGVLVEVLPEHTLLRATDGNCLAVLRVEHQEPPTPGRFWIPRESILPPLPVERGDEDEEAEVDEEPADTLSEGTIITLSPVGVFIPHRPGDEASRFPDFAKVLGSLNPNPVTEISLSGYYLSLYKHVARLLLPFDTLTGLDLRFNGAEHGVEVRIGGYDDFYSVLMPRRAGRGPFNRPDWLPHAVASEDSTMPSF